MLSDDNSGDNDVNGKASGDDGIVKDNDTSYDVDTDAGAKQPSATPITKPTSGKKKRTIRKKKTTEISAPVTLEVRSLTIIYESSLNI